MWLTTALRGSFVKTLWPPPKVIAPQNNWGSHWRKAAAKTYWFIHMRLAPNQRVSFPHPIAVDFHGQKSDSASWKRVPVKANWHSISVCKQSVQRADVINTLESTEVKVLSLASGQPVSPHKSFTGPDVSYLSSSSHESLLYRNNSAAPAGIWQAWLFSIGEN